MQHHNLIAKSNLHSSTNYTTPDPGRALPRRSSRQSPIAITRTVDGLIRAIPFVATARSSNRYKGSDHDSDHSTADIVLEWSPPPSPLSTVCLRKKGEVTFAEASQAAWRLNTPLDLNPDNPSALDAFAQAPTGAIQTGYDLTTKPIRDGHNVRPWFTNRLAVLRSETNRARRAFQDGSATSEHWKTRQRVHKSELRAAKRAFLRAHFADIQDPALLWNLAKLSSSRSAASKFAPLTLPDGSTATATSEKEGVLVAEFLPHSYVKHPLTAPPSYPRMITPEHFGGRPSRSTEDVLITIYESIRHAQRDGLHCELAAMDIKGAYNAEESSPPAAALKCTALPEIETEWVTSFKAGPRTRLKFEGTYREQLRRVTRGRPQAATSWANLCVVAAGPPFFRAVTSALQKTLAYVGPHGSCGCPYDRHSRPHRTIPFSRANMSITAISLSAKLIVGRPHSSHSVVRLILCIRLRLWSRRFAYNIDLVEAAAKLLHLADIGMTWLARSVAPATPLPL